MPLIPLTSWFLRSKVKDWIAVIAEVGMPILKRIAMSHKSKHILIANWCIIRFLPITHSIISIARGNYLTYKWMNYLYKLIGLMLGHPFCASLRGAWFSLYGDTLLISHNTILNTFKCRTSTYIRIHIDQSSFYNLIRLHPTYKDLLL